MVKKQPRHDQSRNHGNNQSKQSNHAGGADPANVIRFTESDIRQRWLVSVEFCPDCERAKKDHADDIASGKLKVADVGSDKGFDIITNLNLFETPVFIIELNDGRYLIDE